MNAVTRANIQPDRLHLVRRWCEREYVDVNFRSLNTGQTPPMLSKRPEISKILLESGADPNMQNRDGNSALHYAIAEGNIELCQLLIGAGAMTSSAVANRDGRTPAGMASGIAELGIGEEFDEKFKQISWKLQKKEVIWTEKFPIVPLLTDVLAIDFEMVGEAEEPDVACEVGIVDANLKTIYHTKCRPDNLAKTGKMGYAKFLTLTGGKWDLRTEFTGIRPGDLDEMVRNFNMCNTYAYKP